MILRYLLKTGVFLIVLILLVGAGGMLLLRTRGLEIRSVQSGSMTPAIKVGDAVIIRHKIVFPKPGDVVSFRSPQQPGVVVTHRIVEIDAERDYILTKGDAADRADMPIHSADLIGIVKESVPRAGYILDAFKHSLGLALLVYVPALCIMVSEMQRLSRYYAAGIGGGREVHYYLYSYLR